MGLLSEGQWDNKMFFCWGLWQTDPEKGILQDSLTLRECGSEHWIWKRDNFTDHCLQWERTWHTGAMVSKTSPHPNQGTWLEENCVCHTMKNDPLYCSSQQHLYPLSKELKTEEIPSQSKRKYSRWEYCYWNPAQKQISSIQFPKQQPGPNHQPRSPGKIHSHKVDTQESKNLPPKILIVNDVSINVKHRC